MHGTPSDAQLILQVIYECLIGAWGLHIWVASFELRLNLSKENRRVPNGEI